MTSADEGMTENPHSLVERRSRQSPRVETAAINCELESKFMYMEDLLGRKAEYIREHSGDIRLYDTASTADTEIRRLRHRLSILSENTQAQRIKKRIQRLEEKNNFLNEEDGRLQQMRMAAKATGSEELQARKALRAQLAVAVERRLTLEKERRVEMRKVKAQETSLNEAESQLKSFQEDFESVNTELRTLQKTELDLNSKINSIKLRLRTLEMEEMSIEHSQKATSARSREIEQLRVLLEKKKSRNLSSKETLNHQLSSASAITRQIQETSVPQYIPEEIEDLTSDEDVSFTIPRPDLDELVAEAKAVLSLDIRDPSKLMSRVELETSRWRNYQFF